MMKVDGICRCGNKLNTTLGKSETACSHCDMIGCSGSPRLCENCKALTDTAGDSEYYCYE